MSRTSCRTIVCIVAVVAATAWPAARAGAEPCYWVSPWGWDWAYGSNWSPHLPTAADEAIINNEGCARVWSTAVCQSLRLGEVWDAVTHDSGMVEIRSGSLSADTEYLGLSGGGAIEQSGGVNTVAAGLYLGHEFLGSGYYKLTDSYAGQSGTVTCQDLYVGYAGGGLFTQEAGAVVVSQTAYLGHSAGSAGTYELSGGGTVTLTANAMVVGLQGRGLFVQSGGAVTVTSVLGIGTGTVGEGTYRLFGGTLKVDAAVQVGTVAGGGDGRFEWFIDALATPSVIVGATGRLAVGFDLAVGDLLDGSLNGGSPPVLANSTLEITNGATVTHDHGAHHFDLLILGTAMGSGTYAVSGTGVLTAQTIEVGWDGEGRFVQDGGTVDVDTLSLGADFWGAGVYRLGGTGALNVGSDLNLGVYGGAGRLEWLGGALTAKRVTMGSGGTLAIGFDFSVARLLSGDLYGGAGPDGLDYGALEVTHGATATLTAVNLDVGSLIVGSASGLSTLLQLSGSVDVDCLSVGWDEGGSGVYSLTGPSTLVARETVVGDTGTGRFVHSDAWHAIRDRLTIGYRGDGTYQLSGAALLTAPTQEIGVYGRAGVLQTAGANFAAEMVMGVAHGSLGTYTLTAGQLTVGDLVVAEAGTGRFVHSGGTHTVTVGLAVGVYGDGSYRLSGTAALIAPTEEVGVYGQGAIVQTGGTNTAGQITLGVAEGGRGVYDISGGELTVGRLLVGAVGSGTLALNSPTATVNVTTALSFGAAGALVAAAPATIHMTGADFENTSTVAANLAGLANLTLIFQGGLVVDDDVELAGQDRGAVAAGWTGNFALGILQLGTGIPTEAGRIRLVNHFDNQPGWAGSQALYTGTLVINAMATIDLGGLSLYYLNGGDPKRFFHGDADLDGDVDVYDLAVLANNYGFCDKDWSEGDFDDGDGCVDVFDLAILANHYGATTTAAAEPVPEPAALALLAAAGLALLRRRRRH